VRKSDEILKDFEQRVIINRLTGWELIELLDVPVEDVLAAALDNDWINEDNIHQLKEMVGLDADSNQQNLD